MTDYDYIKSVKKMKCTITDEVVSYNVTKQDDTILSVPKDTANTDYQNILAWAAIDGNTIAEAD
jgi:hypothetical protein|tara:strand:+ start:28 stop:219 length:192 start_codon:yes stop_codon:yes gene_type:complete